jgi:ribosomal protein S18 acetylase RimI-like enzyme
MPPSSPSSITASTPTAGTLAPGALRRATADDVPFLAQALSAAFYEDPAFEWLMPVDRTRRVQLRRYFEVELRAVGLSCGSVWTTAELAGASISTPPGRWRLPWSTQLRHGPAFARAFGVRLLRAGELLQRMESRHVRSPHHYFAAIGVAPERQGQGLGTSLMRPTLDACDQAGVDAYLEASTERNAALYQRLGFEVIDELRYGGSEPLRLMLRAKRPREQEEALQ